MASRFRSMQAHSASPGACVTDPLQPEGRANLAIQALSQEIPTNCPTTTIQAGRRPACLPPSMHSACQSGRSHGGWHAGTIKVELVRWKAGEIPFPALGPSRPRALRSDWCGWQPRNHGCYHSRMSMIAESPPLERSDGPGCWLGRRIHAFFTSRGAAPTAKRRLTTSAAWRWLPAVAIFPPLQIAASGF